MCDPVSLTVAGAALASTLGSTYLQNREMGKVEDQQAKITDAANRRTAETQALAEKRLDKTMEGFAPGQQAAAADAAAGAREAAATAAIDEAAAGDKGLLDMGGPKEIRAAMGGELRKAIAGGKDQAKRAAEASKFSDLFNQNAINLGRSRSDLGMYGDFAQGNQAGTDAALAAVKPNNTFADILGGLGQLGTAVAVTGAARRPGAPGARRTPGGRHIGGDGRLAGGV